MYFQYPELTHIHGVPKTADLITMQSKVRANLSIVHTTLQGGHHSHLILGCHPAVYANFPISTPYVRLQASPALNVQPGATQFQIQQAQDKHAKDT